MCFVKGAACPWLHVSPTRACACGALRPLGGIARCVVWCQLQLTVSLGFGGLVVGVGA